MSQPTRFNDPSPLVCTEFLPEVEQRFVTGLNLPQQWSVGHQFGKHASELRKQYGKHWKHFVGERGEFEAKLNKKSVVLKFVFLGVDQGTRKPRFEVGDLEFRNTQEAQDTTAPREVSFRWGKVMFRQLKSVRALLILLSTIVGAAAVLLSKGSVLGVEIHKLLGLISVGLGTATAVHFAGSTPIESE